MAPALVGTASVLVQLLLLFIDTAASSSPFSSSSDPSSSSSSASSLLPSPAPAVQLTGWPPLWPHPLAYENGTAATIVSPALTVTILCEGEEIVLERGRSGKGGWKGLGKESKEFPKNDVTEAVDRILPLMFPHRISAGRAGRPHFSDTGMIEKLVISVGKADEALQLSTFENYTLSVPESGAIEITASNQFGAMHALQTLSQLVHFNFDRSEYVANGAPWVIEDAPRFKHREVLVDTARHFEPKSQLFRIIDSMAYAKINVMHWHLTDTQSFPFDSPTYPRLSSFGAYSPYERYSVEDVEDIVEYARSRGIRCVVEIDTPGHAGAMCKGHPEICPSIECTQPLNPVTNKTFEILGGLFHDLTGGKRGSGLFFDNMMHLGGDEVDPTCWKNSSEISAWLNARNMTTDDAYLYMVSRVQDMAHAQGRDVIGWEEIWNHFGTKLDRSTIIQQWLPGSTAAQEAISAGYRAIWSTDGIWYLDHLDVTWQKMYQAEPCTGIDEKLCDALMIGGGGEMWGETADASDVLQTIWPRLAAISERLWSPRSVSDVSKATPRIVAFRCMLNRRGIPAAPPTNENARSAPQGPGSCFAQ